MNKGQRTKNKGLIIWLFFLFVIIAVYFFGLSIPLLGPDEARYAQVAREMCLRGDFVTPTLGEFNWFEKPALLYWLQIFSYKLFGVSEFAARFGSAIFGLGTILSLWILGKFVSNSETKDKGQRTNDEFANWLALISASSIGLLAFSRGASFDIILTFPITASLVGFFIFDSFSQKRKDAKESEEIKQQALKSFKSLRLCAFAGLFAFYIFIGIALLAKGLVGIVFPFVIVAFYHLLSWKFPSKTFIFSLFWGTIISILVASVWYLPMYLTHGQTFIDEFFIQHHLNRFTSNKYQHPQPFYFFFWVLPLMTIPWLPFFLASMWDFSKRFFHYKDTENNIKLSTLDSRLSTFAFAWLLVPLVFFSFSGSKLPGYILPALPAALILTAEYIWRFVQKSEKRKIYVKIFALATFAVVVLILQFFINNFTRRETVKNLIETANANGYATEKVLNLNTISHNAEFYAHGRLVRTDDGKLRRFYEVGEIIEKMKRENINEILVLVPLEHLNQLTESSLVKTKVLGDNTELAIVLVKGTPSS